MKLIECVTNFSEGNDAVVIEKITSSDEDRNIRVNVKKLGSLKDLYNSSIKEIKLHLSSKLQLTEIQQFLEHLFCFIFLNI